MFRVAAILVALAAAMAAFAGPREDFTRYTQGLRGLDGRFEQKVFDRGGRLKEDSTGTVALSAPRLFRWQYLQPNPQTIVADGDHVWIYDPDLEQVTVKNQSSQEANSPLYILIDPTELDRRYILGDGGSQDGLHWLTLMPKGRSEDADFKAARLGFAGDDLRRMEITDNLGQRTQITFSAWRRNPSFARGTFVFVPPKGVDVVGEIEPAAEVHPLRN